MEEFAQKASSVRAVPASVRDWSLPFDADEEYSDVPAPGRTGYWRFPEVATLSRRHLVRWQLLDGRLLAVASCGQRRTAAVHTSPGTLAAAERCSACLQVVERRCGRQIVAGLLLLEYPPVLAARRAARAEARRRDAAGRRRRGGNPYDPMPPAVGAA